MRHQRFVKHSEERVFLFRLLEQTRISFLTWNLGPRRGTGVIERHRREIEYPQDETLTNRFHISHFAGCAVLYNTDTLFPDVRVSSFYIHDTKNRPQQIVREGEAGWAF